MQQEASLRTRLYTIIFTNHTPGGKLFDIGLILAILVSVAVVLLDSVASISAVYGPELRAAEWLFTLLFTVEYGLRLYSARSRLRYALSFFGMVDLLAILPTYASLLIPEGRFMVTIRVLRLLRVFRVLKLSAFVGQQNVLGRALWASRFKITVFVVSVFTIVVIVGSLMYVVEGQPAGFTNIPVSIYWAVVTLTTVGYGDIAPRSPLGQFLAAILMVIGYGVIAVPTGIVTVELGRASATDESLRCPGCGRGGHEAGASFCKYCGDSLE